MPNQDNKNDAQDDIAQGELIDICREAAQCAAWTRMPDPRAGGKWVPDTVALELQIASVALLVTTARCLGMPGAMPRWFMKSLAMAFVEERDEALKNTPGLDLTRAHDKEAAASWSSLNKRLSTYL